MTKQEMHRDVKQVSELIETARQRFNTERDRMIKPILQKGFKNNKLWTEDIQKIAEFMIECERFTEQMAKSAKISAINYELLLKVRSGVVEEITKTIDELHGLIDIKK